MISNPADQITEISDDDEESALHTNGASTNPAIETEELAINTEPEDWFNIDAESLRRLQAAEQEHQAAAALYANVFAESERAKRERELAEEIYNAQLVLQKDAEAKLKEANDKLIATSQLYEQQFELNRSAIQAQQIAESVRQDAEAKLEVAKQKLRHANTLLIQITEETDSSLLSPPLSPSASRHDYSMLDSSSSIQKLELEEQERRALLESKKDDKMETLFQYNQDRIKDLQQIEQMRKHAEQEIIIAEQQYRAAALECQTTELTRQKAEFAQQEAVLERKTAELTHTKMNLEHQFAELSRKEAEQHKYFSLEQERLSQELLQNQAIASENQGAEAMLRQQQLELQEKADLLCRSAEEERSRLEQERRELEQAAELSRQAMERERQDTIAQQRELELQRRELEQAAELFRQAMERERQATVAQQRELELQRRELEQATELSRQAMEQERQATVAQQRELELQRRELEQATELSRQAMEQERQATVAQQRELELQRQAIAREHDQGITILHQFNEQRAELQRREAELQRMRNLELELQGTRERELQLQRELETARSSPPPSPPHNQPAQNLHQQIQDSPPIVQPAVQESPPRETAAQKAARIRAAAGM